MKKKKKNRLAINFKTKSVLRTSVIIVNCIVSRPGGPFLKRPGKITFRAQRQICTFPSHKPLNFASLTAAYIVVFSKLLKL